MENIFRRTELRNFKIIYPSQFHSERFSLYKLWQELLSPFALKRWKYVSTIIISCFLWNITIFEYEKQTHNKLIFTNTIFFHLNLKLFSYFREAFKNKKVRNPISDMTIIELIWVKVLKASLLNKIEEKHSWIVKLDIIYIEITFVTL